VVIGCVVLSSWRKADGLDCGGGLEAGKSCDRGGEADAVGYRSGSVDVGISIAMVAGDERGDVCW